MPKPQTIYSCEKCDAQFPRWLGRCSECGAWGTLKQQLTTKRPTTSTQNLPTGQILNLAQVDQTQLARLTSGLAEFDNLVGPTEHPGLVPGSLILLSGDPGIGKSTLVLQLTAHFASRGQNILYVSGEESAQQIKTRAKRLNLKLEQLNFLGESDIETICATLKQVKPVLAIIDSIQTMFSATLPSAAGSLNQVRAVVSQLLETSKLNNTAIILIGHITKEGQIAGPKTLEHLVDVVLSFEGDPNFHYRLLRVNKNRFGPTGELAVWEMQANGLKPVANPSEIFLTKRTEPLSGSIITATQEGGRVFMLEIQALVTKTAFGYPQRKVAGYDLNRLNMLVAVLIKRAEIWLTNRDLHLNLAGGFKTKEPALDLAAALAIASAYYNHPISPDLVVLGEVGLGGEIRPVPHLASRLKEIKRLGFKAVVLPDNSEIPANYSLDLILVKTLKEAIQKVIQ
ncbi:MAG: DNA repair protein RadA [Candidatus Buchananbacteria bacterium]